MDIRSILFALSVFVITLCTTYGTQDSKLSSSLEKIIEKDEPSAISVDDSEKPSELYDIIDNLSDEDDLDKRTLFRYGKRGALFRYGKRGALMRYGKRGALMRYGKRGALFRYGKRGALMRYGKRDEYDLDLGTAGAKRLMRWGKRSDDNEESDQYQWGNGDDLAEEKRRIMRYGKRDDVSSDELDKRTLFRYGKRDMASDDELTENEKRRIMRYGRDTRANKPHVPFRFGREE